MTTVFTAVRDAARRLAAAGIDSARLDARVLLAEIRGVAPERIMLDADRLLSDAEARAFATLVARRAAREPVARLLGRREFWSLDFALDRDALVPRPDSETVIEAALAMASGRAPPRRVLDLGTGSGCLLLALLHEWPEASGIGVDRAEGACRVARDNAGRLGLGDRARFVCGDWTAALGARFDLVVANPPYIATAALAGLMPEVRDHEPRRALDGGADGLDAYRAIALGLRGALAPGGAAVLEIGSDQAAAVGRLLEAAGFRAPLVRADLAGRPRAVVVSAPPVPQPSAEKGVGFSAAGV